MSKTNVYIACLLFSLFGFRAWSVEKEPRCPPTLSAHDAQTSEVSFPKKSNYGLNRAKPYNFFIRVPGISGVEHRLYGPEYDLHKDFDSYFNIFSIVRGQQEGKAEVFLESSSVESSCEPGKVMGFECNVSVIFPEINSEVTFESKMSSEMSVCLKIFDDLRGKNPVVIDGGVRR